MNGRRRLQDSSKKLKMAVPNSAEMSTCPQCGAELGSDGLAGLCPQCLIQGALDSEVGTDESRTQTIHALTAPAGDDDFGRYQILRPLGEGGMGTVYLAEQREPIRRYVALKVIKLGMDTSQVLARFSHERQTLAVMAHPNIARILDAGATPKGRPYFVMEYIEGTPITEYCDRKQMTVSQRLELFLVVCRAVRHAHQKGVIHRDLKPSNVLVMEQDGTPVPKVIDFGIAKATDQWAVESTLLTQFGQMVGTPEYASPEQAEVMTGVVDETSDVYSLGVLMYELLIGTVPFNVNRMLKAGLAEMLRIIREDEAPSLPGKLTLMGAAASDIAARRQTDPVSLRRLVNGDLNWITLKALEKDRERRYPSVAELAADIQRYMEHRPVLASPPTSLYRARKFLRRHKSGTIRSGSALAVIVSSAVAIWFYSSRVAKPVLTMKDTLLVGGFANKTGDPAFDDTLRQGLIFQLQQSPYLSLISDPKIRATLKLMQKPADSALTGDTAREVCERVGANAMLTGSIARLGNRYVMNLRTEGCVSGELIDDQQLESNGKEQVLNTLSDMAGKFRAHAGESLAAIREHDVPLKEGTTTSLDALKAYTSGYLLSGVNDKQTALHFRRALELDPEFAGAWSMLAIIYSNLGETAMARESATKAYQFRQHASGPERFSIEYSYHRNVTGNLEKAWEVATLWRSTYPRDSEAFGLSGGYAANGTGRFKEALEASIKAMELDPDLHRAYGNRAEILMRMGRLDEAESAFSQAATHGISMGFERGSWYQLGFVKNSPSVMEAALADSQTNVETDIIMTHVQALAAARDGRIEEANRLSRRAANLAKASGWAERAAVVLAGPAVWNAFYGNREPARSSAESALKMFEGRDAIYAAGFALGLTGKGSLAEALADKLNKAYPEDTQVQATYIPTLRALAAMAGNNPQSAVELLEPNRRYEYAISPLAFNHFYGKMYPIYVRGLAYLAMNRGPDAVGEFRRLLDHPGLYAGDPVESAARFQLARAWLLTGNKEEAQRANQELLRIWKDASPTLPLLREAKAAETRFLHDGLGSGATLSSRK